MEVPTSQSSPSYLETLPVDVFEQVCEYLAELDSHKHSLYSLSLASKACCSAALKRRFDRIELVVRGKAKLHRDVERWCQILEGRAILVGDLHIKVYEPLPSFAHEITAGKTWCSITETYCSPPSTHDGQNRHEIYDNREEEERDRRQDPDWWQEGWTEEDKMEKDNDWLPLARLVSTLPRLKNLFFPSTRRLLPCVLAAVHQHCPTSRLHISDFRLGSLAYPKTTGLQPAISPHELALATSPCLYSIIVWQYDDNLDRSIVNYHEEAVLSMTAGLAPGLKHVRLHYYESLESTRAENARARYPRRPWEGFLPDKPLEIGTARGHLQSLTIDGANPDSPALIKAWSQHTHFNELKYLCIRTRLDLDGLQTLADLGEAGELASVRSLALILPKPDMNLGDRHLILSVIDRLLQSIQPLEELQLRGYLDEAVFTSILNRHGRTLRKLVVLHAPSEDRNTNTSAPMLVVDCNRALQLAQRCPDLEVLKVVVRRTQGDEREVAIYHNLSKLTRLKRVSLYLDYSSERLPAPAPGDRAVTVHPGVQISFRHMRDAFINAATDETLAAAIFRAVAGGKDTLEHLHLRVLDPLDMNRVYQNDGFNVIHGILNYLSMPCLVRKDPSLGLVVTPINFEAWTSWQWLHLEAQSPDFDKMYKEVWSSIWPCPDGGTFHDTWWSFSLVGGLG